MTTGGLLNSLSVIGVHGTADVHGSQDGKDERLEEAHEDLEAGEGEEQAKAERQDDDENALSRIG